METKQNDIMKEQTFGIVGGRKEQIAGKVFVSALSSMKELLNMGEFKFGGKESSSFKFYKKEVMNQTYSMLDEVFREMEKSGMVEECGCGAKVTKDKRSGFSLCQWCNGSGYKNTKEFNGFLNK